MDEDLHLFLVENPGVRLFWAMDTKNGTDLKIAEGIEFGLEHIDRKLTDVVNILMILKSIFPEIHWTVDMVII